MKSFIVLACLLGLALASNSEWESFKTKFGRLYKNPTEEAFRKKIFLNNKMAIDQQNQRFAEGKSTFTMGINQFSDLTTQEFSETMNNYIMQERDPAHVQEFPVHQVNAATVDYRDSGCVTAVKNQGQCGSCWSFSTTGSTEYVNCMANNKILTSLSEQNLVDCSYKEGNMGCNGGLMTSAFKYIISNGGIDTEASYPYTAKSQVNNCQYNAEYSGGTLSAYRDVASGDEKALESAVYNIGPISVAIDASHMSFQLYTNGVYDEPLCSSKNLDHGVLVVGYGVDGITPYWLVKNSWGITWGMQGYIEMSKDKNNQCGIATQASYPIYKIA